MNDIERRTLIGAAGIGAIAALSKAGPLNPPAGAVAGTGRTTDEIYNKIPAGDGGNGRIAIPGGSTPVTLFTPGAYILTGNLNTAANGTADAITTNVGNIDIDLNGYTISAGASRYGVFVGTGGTRIHNGLISGCARGVSINGSATSVILEDLQIDRCRTIGIIAMGLGNTGVVVRRCTITDIGATSLAGDPASTGYYGVQLFGSGSTVIDCIVSRMVALSPTPVYRGILIGGVSGNIVERCRVTSDVAVSGTGVLFSGTGVYRDNTVLNFSTAYSGGTNGGGNV